MGLVDGYLKCWPGARGVTWRNTLGAERRLDYVFVSAELVCKAAMLTPLWFSDHDGVRVSLRVGAPVFGTGYWRLIVNILREKEFRDLFVSYFAEWLELKRACTSVIDWWEGTKTKIKKVAMFYCRRRCARRRGAVAGMQRALEQLYNAANKGAPFEAGRVAEVKAALADHYKREAKGFLFRSRCTGLGQDETCSSFFFGAVKGAQKKRVFVGLRNRENAVVSDPDGMVEVASAFYRVLFSVKVVDELGAGSFLNCVTARVPEGVRAELEQDISLDELSAALAAMAKGKVPGVDGLPMEFYSTSWDLLGVVLLEVGREVVAVGRLGDSMREGVFSFCLRRENQRILAIGTP